MAQLTTENFLWESFEWSLVLCTTKPTQAQPFTRNIHSWCSLCFSEDLKPFFWFQPSSSTAKGSLWTLFHYFFRNIWNFLLLVLSFASRMGWAQVITRMPSFDRKPKIYSLRRKTSTPEKGNLDHKLGEIASRTLSARLGLQKKDKLIFLIIDFYQLSWIEILLHDTNPLGFRNDLQKLIF